MSFNTPTGTRGGRGSAPGAVGRRVQNWVQKQMMRRIRRSGWKLAGMDVLFLTTVGRRSGAERTTPVAWFPGADGTWLIVASAGGAARNPAWYHNIAAQPDNLQIELGGRKAAVTAEQLSGTTREEAWRQIVAAQPRFVKYQQKTDRQLPVIRLTPRSA
ncbi:MAG TPA: nitroreductase/quinone reductase family protein [Trebonia sp.]